MLNGYTVKEVILCCCVIDVDVWLPMKRIYNFVYCIITNWRFDYRYFASINIYYYYRKYKRDNDGC